MDLEEYCHGGQLADMMDTMTRVEETAKLCIPRPQSKWSQWAEKLLTRVGEREEELAKLRSVADSLPEKTSGSSQDPSSHGSPQVEQQPVASSTGDEDASDWLRGWNAATAEALPEVQKLEQVCH